MCVHARVDFSLCLKSTPITPIKDYMNERTKQGKKDRGIEGAGSYKKTITKEERCNTKQIVREALNILYMNVCGCDFFSHKSDECFLFYPTSAKLLQPGLKMSQNVCMSIFDVDNIHALYTVFFTCWINS